MAAWGDLFKPKGNTMTNYISSLLYRSIAQDASPSNSVSLAEHDKRFHPNGFDPSKDRCKLREELAKGDEADMVWAERLEDSEQNSMKRMIEDAKKALKEYNKDLVDAVLNNGECRHEIDAEEYLRDAIWEGGVYAIKSKPEDVAVTEAIGDLHLEDTDRNRKLVKQEILNAVKKQDAAMKAYLKE